LNGIKVRLKCNPINPQDTPHRIAETENTRMQIREDKNAGRASCALIPLSNIRRRKEKKKKKKRKKERERKKKERKKM